MLLIIRYSLLFFIFLQVQNCENPKDSTTTESTIKNQINSMDTITVAHFGGMLGHNEQMTINSKTITYSFKNVPNPKPKIQEIATPPQLWQELNRLFDENQYRSLEDGDFHRVYDGTDMVFTVKGDFGELQVTNPVDKNEDLKAFFELLDATRKEFYMKNAQ